MMIQQLATYVEVDASWMHGGDAHRNFPIRSTVSGTILKPVGVTIL